MASHMPRDVVRRRSKVGFIESATYFFSPPVVLWMGDIIASQGFQESSLWNGRQIAGVFDRWKKGGSIAPMVGKKLLGVASAHYLFSRLSGTGAFATSAPAGSRDQPYKGGVAA